MRSGCSASEKMEVVSLTLFAVLALLSAGRVDGAAMPEPEEEILYWDNSFTGYLYVDCDCGYALHRVWSEYDHDNETMDRRWDWQCVEVGHVGNEECQWYEDVNEVEKHLVFRCPRRQYMAGIKSSFTASASDRVWDIKCCQRLGVCPDECELSCGSVNDFEEDFDYSAREGGVFVGVVSRYATPFSDETDRQWWIEQCQASKCQLFPGIELREAGDEGEEEWEEEKGEE